MTATAPVSVPGRAEPQDHAAILDGVRAFRRRELDVFGERPEVVPTGTQLASVSDAAYEAGLVGDEASPLWSGPDEDAVTCTLAALPILAEPQAGVAFHLHQLALAELVSGQIESTVTPGTVLAIEGGAGLARGALVRQLAGVPFEPDDHELLAAAYPPDASGPVLLQAPEPTDLLLPRYTGPGTLALEHVERPALTAVSRGPGHGLDGLTSWEIRAPRGAGRRLAEGEPARRALQVALTAHALALLAIGLGSVTGTWARVWPYSADRVQGGRPIRSHPAVQQLLAEASSTILVLQRLLAGPPGLDEPDALSTALALRARLHPQLCSAATALVQVLGGYGYMRDTGAERSLRDNQHLRLCAGAPSELALALVAAEQAR